CLSASGKRTGVGHHTAELFAALRRLETGDAIDAFPSAWVGRVRNVWLDVRPLLEPRTPPKQLALPASGSAGPGFKARLFQWVRRHGQALVAANFRQFLRAGKYDLYHEPNFIPFHCDAPIVATIHDLSVLHHADWHPADRVAHFEKHFL